MIKFGEKEYATSMGGMIKNTGSNLKSKINQIFTAGCTALGPSVALSIAMAGKGKSGSQVTVCTDGMANVGIGSLSYYGGQDIASENFYQGLGKYAQSKGVTVNVISITGAECNIQVLSKMAQLTGGNVARYSAHDLTKNVEKFVSKPIIATNVVLKVMLHKGLKFRREDPQSLSNDGSILVKEIGNVSEDTQITFEYQLKSIAKLLEMEDVDLTAIKKFPFQAQISYRALDGSKCIRVITQ